jgi:hypothetical protein
MCALYSGMTSRFTGNVTIYVKYEIYFGLLYLSISVPSVKIAPYGKFKVQIVLEVI